jgi:hypothetical protein
LQTEVIAVGASVFSQPFVKRRIFQHGESRPYSDRINVTFPRKSQKMACTSTMCSFYSVRSCITIRSLLFSYAVSKVGGGPRPQKMGSRLLFTNEIFQASKLRNQDRAPESVARSRSEARGFTRLCHVHVTPKLRVRCASRRPRITQMLRAPAGRGAHDKGCYFWIHVAKVTLETLRTLATT